MRSVQTESVIKRDIKRWLTSRGYYWSSLDAGTVGHRMGDPDLVACIGGMYVAIEVKTPVGRLSPRQREVREMILNSGGTFCVARSVEDVRQVEISIISASVAP